MSVVQELCNKTMADARAEVQVVMLVDTQLATCSYELCMFIAVEIICIGQNCKYSAAQICPNQNIRVMRVGPILVYAYAYTHIRVCIYAHTRIQYIRVCLIGMYELTYCFFLFLQVIVIFNGLTACHRVRKSFLYFDKQAT